MADEVENTGMHVSGDKYDMPYFAARHQDRDRPALWFYERLVRRWIHPGRILDYGCGTGFMLRRLSRYYETAGFDLSSEARRSTIANVPGVTVYDCEGDIPASCFSGIVSLHVLEHIDRSVIPAVLNLWSNALVPGGRVLCVVPDAEGRGHALAGNRWTGFGDPTHVTLNGHSEWQSIFTTAGFRVASIGTDGLWCLPYRAGKSKLVDGLKYSLPTALQFVLGRLLLSPGSGESAIFLLENNP